MSTSCILLSLYLPHRGWLQSYLVHNIWIQVLMMYINIVQWWMCNMKLFYIDFQSDLIQACLISFYQGKTSLISWGDDTDKPYLLIFILRSGLLEVQTREWRQGSRKGRLNVRGTWSCTALKCMQSTSISNDTFIVRGTIYKRILMCPLIEIVDLQESSWYGFIHSEKT